MLQLLPVHLQGVGQKCGRHHNILREDELATYPQGGWARGLFIVLSITMVLVTTYPQGGWARYISSGRMSSRTILCSFNNMVVVTTISSGRMSSLHILSEDELEDHSWFSLLLGYLVTISSWRMGSRTTNGSPYCQVTQPQYPHGWAWELFIVLLPPLYPNGKWALFMPTYISWWLYLWGV